MFHVEPKKKPLEITIAPIDKNYIVHWIRLSEDKKTIALSMQWPTKSLIEKRMLNAIALEGLILMRI